MKENGRGSGDDLSGQADSTLTRFGLRHSQFWHLSFSVFWLAPSQMRASSFRSLQMIHNEDQLQSTIYHLRVTNFKSSRHKCCRQPIPRTNIHTSSLLTIFPHSALCVTTFSLHVVLLPSLAFLHPNPIMDIASLCQTDDVPPHYRSHTSPKSTQSSPPLRRPSTSDQPHVPPPLPTPTSSMGINSLLNAAPNVRRSSHSSYPDSPDRKSESNESRSTSASYAETIMTQYTESTSPSTKRKALEDVTPNAEPARKKVKKPGSVSGQDFKSPDTSKPREIQKLPPRLPKPIWAQSWREYAKVSEGSRQPPSEPEKPVMEFEPSIQFATPTDTIVNKVSDFVYLNIMNKDVGQYLTSHQGVTLEIEAKLGQLKDRSTSQRLDLPVATEAVIDRSRHPDMHLLFESTMTELQHRHLNNFLNESTRQSLAKASADRAQSLSKVRDSIVYKHTREVDTFRGLTEAGIRKLPDFMRDHRKPPKVRITRQQDKGDDKILAMIVKSRVADLDIFCPELPVDCRISINYEMAYDGSMDDLLTPENDPSERASRQKDRMSYKHQACQIDLTQVTLGPTRPGSSHQTQKEHELEIELAVDTAQQQAKLLLAGKPNSYHSLIGSFCNNIRTLARELRNTPTRQPTTPIK